MPEVLTTGIWVGLAAILGLLIGSFLNVCIYRLPAGITIVRGHSFCPNCKHPLGGLDLVPVFSYLLLGRRCRYCRQPISPRYVHIELLAGAYFALVALIWRPGRFTLPPWLAGCLDLPDAAAEAMAALEAGALLAAAAALTFSGLLVWAMIIWDGHRPPAGLFLFTLLPASVRLALQPERLPSHMAALLLSMILVLLLLWLRLLPPAAGPVRLQISAGIGLLGLMAGLSAIQPVLALWLAELTVLAFRKGRKEVSAGQSAQADLLWRSLPLQSLLAGAVLWLVF